MAESCKRAGFARYFVGRSIIALMAFTISACSTVNRLPTVQAGAYTCANHESVGQVIVAHVAAFEQAYRYNRYGARNSNGLVFALRRDIVLADDAVAEVAIAPLAGSGDMELAGEVRLRKDKRARPMVLRVREGDILEVHFTNLIGTADESGQRSPDIANPGFIMPNDRDELATRDVSFHVNGLEPDGDIRALGANVGRNPRSTVHPGETVVIRYRAQAEGTYLLHSAADPVGGEGYGGQTGLGLFGAINIEPRCSRWYRSQVDEATMHDVTTSKTAIDTPIIDYDWKRGAMPRLGLVNAANEIVHSDLNAIIEQDRAEDEHCPALKTGPAANCGLSFREFTAIFHDEATVDQAFAQLDDEDDPISAIRDGMGINYGVSGLGSMVLANRALDPAGKPIFALDSSRSCIECKLEEFFLTAWVVGDPAMIFDRGADRRAIAARFADDPSNVHHSYMGDPVRFRNIHAGPKETHVFHLHAHQWVRDWANDKSVYLDSQTISPGSTYTYEIQYGGSGNRNVEVGDSIFHCHLYPHFAQGMWAMWRTHDSFEDGMAGMYDPYKTANDVTNNPRWRNLPDAELAGGTPSPAIVPIPGRALPPLPSEDLPGYPFYIAGRIGHRPPQPPLDLEPGDDGGIGRHVIIAGTREAGTDDNPVSAANAVEHKYFDVGHAVANGLSLASVKNATRVRALNGSRNLTALASRLTSADIFQLPLDGSASEQRAMTFHHGLALQFGGRVSAAVPFAAKRFELNLEGYPSCDSAGHCYATTPGHPDSLLFAVNGHAPKPGAPFADPCPATSDTQDFGVDPLRKLVERTYRASYIQFDMPVNRSGWHDPQARIIVLDQDVEDTLRPASDPKNRPAEPFFFRANSGECVVFKGTNLMPSVLNLDDFQVYSPTDTIGQHIHLVKFDVTSSDGSANGWNYEDATMSPDEIRERIIAANAWRSTHAGSGAPLAPTVHRLFRPGGALYGTAAHHPYRDMGQCGSIQAHWNDHPWCGAQTSIQRWWADPLKDNDGHDRTIRTVFTHDHLGPSSHQHHGLYAALVVEPTGSRWTSLDGAVTLGGTDAAGAQIVNRVDDGGPTSFKANILAVDEKGKRLDAREFNLAFADYSILYTDDNKPVSPPNKREERFPRLVSFDPKPEPEGISTKDPGSQLVNYRNEPIPLRIGMERPGDKRWVQSDRDDGNACLDRELLRYMGGNPAHPERDPLIRLPIEGQVSIGTPVTVIAAGSGETNRGELGNGANPAVVAALRKRLCAKGDMANVFSSRAHGDPATQILEAYQGDRINLRMVQGAQEENHVFVTHGGNWLTQPDIAGSGNVNGQQIGISEHFEFNVKVTSPQASAPVTDYFYAASATDNLWDGQWGLIRAYAFDQTHPFLARLPNNPAVPSAMAADFNFRDPLSSVCPDSDHLRRIGVTARRQEIVYNSRYNLRDPNGIVFVQDGPEGETRQRNGNGAIVAGTSPLVIRIGAGECVRLLLRNELSGTIDDGPTAIDSYSYNMMPPTIDRFNFNDFKTSSRVSLHPQLVATNGYRDDGSYVGYNTDSSCAADVSCGGGGRNTIWYGGQFDLVVVNGQVVGRLTPVEFGVGAIQDFGDVIKHSSHGAMGAVVVEPADAQWDTDCQMTAGIECSNAAATVRTKDADGKDATFREMVLVYQDDASVQYNGQPLANMGGEDDAEDTGARAFNYRMEPLWARIGGSIGDEREDLFNSDWSNILSSNFCDGSLANGGRDGRPGPSPCPSGIAGTAVDPETPLLTALPGIYTRIRIVHPRGHPRNHAFTLYGHNWSQYPWTGPVGDGRDPAGSRSQIYTNDWSPRVGILDGFGPGRSFNLLLEHAGGVGALPGDYLYRSQDNMAFYSGQWGIVRVPATCHAVGDRMKDADGHVCR